MTHYTRSKRTTAGFVPRTTIPRVDHFPMQKVTLSPAKVKTVPATTRVKRRLEDILHQELSLSVARGVLTNLDSMVKYPFTVDLTWHGLNVKLIIHADTFAARQIMDSLLNSPNVRLGNGMVVIGGDGEPCALVAIEWCGSGIDTNGGGA